MNVNGKYLIINFIFLIFKYCVWNELELKFDYLIWYIFGELFSNIF